MEILIKCFAACIFGSLICLLIKKQNPELSLLLGIAITVSVLIAFSEMFSLLVQLMKYSKNLIGDGTELLKPLIKCMCIAFITKLGADICRDASQSALASSLEFGGTLCAAASTVPMIISTLEIIGTTI
jgi:stage III sporulation protein AD